MIDKIISHYKIIEEIGRGGMGEVFLAEDIKLDRKVALKFLPKNLTADREARERFEREAKAAAALNHANIVTIHEIGEHEGQIFIAMEYVEGRTLKEHRDSPLHINQAIDISNQVAAGLQAAHEKGIVHRDIKPANIMITRDGAAKILDFGLAKLKGQVGQTRVGTTLGTVAYMSPEQAMGNEIDQRTDIWSLGVVLYEMLTSQLPFKGDYEQAMVYSILNEEPEALSKIRSGIPPELEQIVQKALEKHHDKRYPSIHEMRQDLAAYQATYFVPALHSKGFRGIIKTIKQPKVVVLIIFFMLALGYAGLRSIKHASRARQAREVWLPEIMQLTEASEFSAAFQLARQAEQRIPQDPILKKIWPKISIKISLQTNPPGADVYVKGYRATQNKWEHIGQTPLEKVLIPMGFFRWKIEKQGYEIVERASDGSDFSGNTVLEKSGALPAGMIRIPGGKEALRIIELSSLPQSHLDDFFIDRFEVTNRQYKVFVDQGGYLKPEYWKQPFRRNNKTITWQEAMKEFRDATGRPGPATWELGAFPEGQEDFPVSGVSWFEAAAYAEFADKELPTVYHWSRAASIEDGPHIIPSSNFKNKGPAPAGAFPGLGHYGTYDMAGNVREWCWNQTGEGHFILGGAWDDMDYLFNHTGEKSPFDRSPGNGFRCVKYLESGAGLEKAKLPVQVPGLRDYAKEKPVEDKIFRVYAGLYTYEKSSLDPLIETVDEKSRYWRKEKVTMNAGYNRERLIVYLFLPKQGTPPYQTVVVFPGANALSRKSSQDEEDLVSFDMIDFLIRGGRAGIYPIYKSMYERRDGYSVYNPDATPQSFREHILMWRVDLGRALDYLETRVDIDHDRLALCGSSLGAAMSIGLLAVEDRFKVGFARGCGLPTYKLPPDIDTLNFTPRVKVPFLMLNGRYDLVFPFQTSQLPLFNHLGTAASQKRLVLFECGHTALTPRSKFMQEVLDWFDRYLGPVKPTRTKASLPS